MLSPKCCQCMSTLSKAFCLRMSITLIPFSSLLCGKNETPSIIVGVSRKSFIILLTFMCEKQCLEQGCKWEEGGWSERSVNSVMLLGLMSHRWCSLCEKAGYSRSDSTPALTYPRVPSGREGMSCHLMGSHDHTQNNCFIVVGFLFFKIEELWLLLINPIHILNI